MFDPTYPGAAQKAVVLGLLSNALRTGHGGRVPSTSAPDPGSAGSATTRRRETRQVCLANQLAHVPSSVPRARLRFAALGSARRRGHATDPVFAHSNTGVVTKSGSQIGSQRSQCPGDARPQLARIGAVIWLIERHQATHRDAATVPSKQRVAGSNPAGRTALFSQVKSYGGTQADRVAVSPLTGSQRNAS
jgi:hypothetical protein